MSLHSRATDEPPTTRKTDGATDEPAVPIIISHADMNTAYDQGLVTPLGHTIGYAVRYQGTWWIHYEGGWIRTDPALAATLDTEAARITAQDAIIARNAAIRAVTKSNQQIDE